jgi:hypothetical protein
MKAKYDANGVQWCSVVITDLEAGKEEAVRVQKTLARAQREIEKAIDSFQFHLDVAAEARTPKRPRREEPTQAVAQRSGR